MMNFILKIALENDSEQNFVYYYSLKFFETQNLHT